MNKILFFYFYLCGAVLFGQVSPAADNIELEYLQSNYDESHPVISTNGKTFYFSRRGHPQNIGEDDHFDIWIAFRKKSEVWGQAIHMPLPLNNRADNFVVASEADGLGLYLYDGNQSLGSELVYTQKRGRSWTNPKPVQIQNFDPKSTPAFSMTNDSEIVLLATKGESGQGGYDIYVSTKIEKTVWSTPINLGKTINSSNEEYFARLAADNKTLYFLRTEADEPSLMRLMTSQRTGIDWTSWSTPESTNIILDATLFDPHFSISANGKRMYIAGEMKEDGELQLFSFLIPDQHQPDAVSVLMGKLVDAESGFELDGNVMLESLTSFEESQSLQTNRGGQFQFVLPGESAFTLSADVPGYFAKSELIADQSLQELDKEEGAGSKNGEFLSPEVDQLNVRLQQLHKSMQELDQQRTATHQEMEKQGRLNWSPSKGNDKLSALEVKYQKALGLETPQKAVMSTTGDSELDAMKRAFRKHNDVQEEANTLAEKSVVPKEESQLEAMKRKYNEANNITTTTEEMEEAVVASTAPHTHSSFSDLVVQSRSELEEELSERVVKELRADLLQEVSFKMHASMDTDSREQYAGSLQRKTEILESEVRKELRKKYKNQVKRELRGEMLEVVEAELRELLREEVKRELRAELEAEVRKELRLELEYLLTQEMATDLQKELNTLIKQLKKKTVTAPGKYYDGATTNNTKVKKGNSGSQEIKIELYPLKKGRVIPLENIFFEANSDQWKNNSISELNRIYDLLVNNPALIIEIGGHSNGWCSTEFANKISTDRARAVADFLLERGIAQDRLSWKGYGKTQPLVPNDSVENCKKNQRLEIRIL